MMSFEEEFRELMEKEKISFDRDLSPVLQDEVAHRIHCNTYLTGVVTEISTSGNQPDILYPAVQLISNNLGLCRVLNISLTEFMVELCKGCSSVNEMPRTAYEITHGRIYDRIAELVIFNGKLAGYKAEGLEIDINNSVQGMFLASLAIYHHVTPQWLKPQLHFLWKM